MILKIAVIGGYLISRAGALAGHVVYGHLQASQAAPAVNWSIPHY